jgi:hypothetical protein
MSATWKVTSGKLLTKQAIRRGNNLLYTKNMYILNLLLNVVTARTEALIIPGNKFCMPISKKSAASELQSSIRNNLHNGLHKNTEICRMTGIS